MFSSSVRTLLNLLPLLLPITDTAAIPTGLAPLTPRAVKCGKEQRIAGAKCVPFAYNQPDIGASTQGFIDCPFADDLQTYLYPRTGVPGIHVGRTGNQLRAAAIATRQVFSHVEGSYIDFAKNSTTDLVVDITFGARDIIPLPASFLANVYLAYDEDCMINQVQAYAEIPTKVLGILIPTMLDAADAAEG